MSQVFDSSIVRWGLVAILVAHGVAHFVGFAVAWRLTSSPEVPYHTTVLNGRVAVGDLGAQILGMLWLLVGGSFVGAALGIAMHFRHALLAAVIVTVASLVLCVLEWPFAKIGLAIDVLLLAALPVAGVLLWRADTLGTERALSAAQLDTVPAAEEDALPPPVARYLIRVLPTPLRAIHRVTLTQDAEFFVGGQWRPLRATQQFTVGTPGFVWDAQIAMAPLMSVYVRDAYVGGHASMTADFMGLASITRQANRTELDAGALHRYLAEAVWFPAALTESYGVRWTELSDRAARATLHDAHSTVSAEFRFNQDDEVEEIFVPDRFAETNGRYEPRPWLVRCSHYETREGVRIPTVCEVEWQLPTGPQPYWRGRVADIHYE